MRLAVIGAGLMGGGLAHVFSKSGWEVAVYDPIAAALEQLPARVAGFRDGGAPNSGRVWGTSVLHDAVATADLVIEAAPEKPPLKQSIFADLVAATGAGTILATNSSVIPVGVVTASVPDSQAGRCLGTHFWNPPDLVPLVEVIQGPRTELAAIQRTMEMLRSVGKQPVHVRRDVVPGNRLQHALWREAMALVDEGVCTPEDVDALVRNSFALRLPALGPLENADLVGLGLTADIHRVVLPTLSRATEPARCLTERIAAGHNGVATGSGFHQGWNAENVAELRQRLSAHIKAELTLRKR
jgi:3-hydroxybutyryl-CoA dehydrogenase